MLIGSESMTKKTKELKFDEALSTLEKYVEKLEDGNLSLEESLKIFEEGMKLTKFCEQKLSEAEGKVEILKKSTQGGPEGSNEE